MKDCALLTETRKITSIQWGREGEGWRGISLPEISTIEIEPVTGQGAYVPWVAVNYTDGSVTKFNAAELLSITYASRENR